MTARNLIQYDPPKFITEREVRLAGQVSQRRSSLRGALHQGIETGSVTIKTRNGTQSITLPKEELEAVLGLLIERDEAFLVGLNVELEN